MVWIICLVCRILIIVQWKQPTEMSVLTLEAKLERQDSTTPWGFRMQGGKDFSSPITIARVWSYLLNYFPFCNGFGPRLMLRVNVTENIRIKASGRKSRSNSFDVRFLYCKVCLAMFLMRFFNLYIYSLTYRIPNVTQLLEHMLYLKKISWKLKINLFVKFEEFKPYQVKIQAPNAIKSLIFKKFCHLDLNRNQKKVTGRIWFMFFQLYCPFWGTETFKNVWILFTI